jgi:allantoin racemase
VKILLLNPNTTEEMTRDMEEQALRYARPGTEVEGMTAPFGAASIEGHYEEEYAILHFLEAIKDRAAEFDGVILSCYGDPGLNAAREISPVPVVGIAGASMLMACTVAHKFSIVTVIPRVKPMMEDLIRRHGLESRCASIRTTPLSVLDCERDPAAAEREIVKASKAAIAEDGAEAILLGCGGMGPLDQKVGAVIDAPVIDGIPCAVKLLEGMYDYGLNTSRVAAFKEPEPKEWIEYAGRVPA